MLISTKLSDLIATSSDSNFSRKGISSIRIDYSLKLDLECKQSCNKTHNHGFLESCENQFFITNLNSLDKLPSYNVLKRGVDELERFQKQNNVKACITWIGYFVESFTAADLSLLKELVLYQNKTGSQIKLEESLWKRESDVPKGLDTLHGKQEKFFDELWNIK